MWEGGVCVSHPAVQYGMAKSAILNNKEPDDVANKIIIMTAIKVENICWCDKCETAMQAGKASVL